MVEIRKRGLKLGKVPFNDLEWSGQLMKDLKMVNHSKHRLTAEIVKRKAELTRQQINFDAEKKFMVDNILAREDRLDKLGVQIINLEKEIDKLKPKKKRKAKPKPELIPEIKEEDTFMVGDVADKIKESLKETIEDITDEIIEHQEKTITEVKKSINGKFEQTIIQGKILCPECIIAGKTESESLFTKGGAFISHYKSHFKNGNGDGDV